MQARAQKRRFDPLTPAQRTHTMRAVHGKDTKPELAVRRLVHGMGFRYRLHGRHLPGNPDMVFTSRRKVVFVHGCFWHRHPRCRHATTPKTRQHYWLPKLRGNRRRDLANIRALEAEGWEVLVVWECEIADTDDLAARLQRFLSEESL